MASVQVICDLRNFDLSITHKKYFNENEFLREFTAHFQQASRAFMGQPLSQGMPLAVKLPRGTFTLWVVDSAGVQRVEQNTEFHVVDVLRQPIILYECQECRKYGPLRCETCKAEGVQNGKERICSDHAYLIEDTSLAYCKEHRPRCQCSPNCVETATFFCSGCYSRVERYRRGHPTKFYGDHVRHYHPHNNDICYCDHCFDRLFRPCRICEAGGEKVSVGKLRCEFRTGNSKDPCGEARCWDHSFQWKIWGPDFPGIVLCEQHRQFLAIAHPAVLLFTLLSSQPPPGRGEKYPYSLQNIYRVRRLINRNRQTPVTFEQLGPALEMLARPGVPWMPGPKRRYDELFQLYQRFMQGRPQKLQELLQRTRQFYQKIGRPALAQQIIQLDIADQLRGGDKSGQYIIHLYLSAPLDVGPFIGKDGILIKQLSADLNMNCWADFFYSQNGTVTRLGK